MLSSTIFIFGLIIGSFLNVCIYRLPRNISVVTPPSHCIRCGTCIQFYDLIPVISYIVLRGRCRNCDISISSRYAIVELITACLFLWCHYVIDTSTELGRVLLLTSLLVVISYIDIDHQLILDKVVIGLAGTGVVINLWLGTVGTTDMLIAALIGGGMMLVIAVASRGGMGGGDIKFAAALGLWLGWKLTLLTLFLAFVLGGIGGIAVLAFKLKGRKDFIPFGPFIAVGAFISLLYGNEIIQWYLSYI